MYHGDRRPYNIPKDVWGYHLDAEEISRQFIPYLMLILGSNVSPIEAPNLAAVSVHIEYFRVSIPAASGAEQHMALEAVIKSIEEEQPSRMIQMLSEEDNVGLLFIREIKTDPLDTYN